MNYLLYNKGSFISARLLATLLGLKAVNNPSKVNYGKVAIRYGNSYGNFNDDTSINKPDVIKLCSNSILFCNWCLDNGFYTPQYMGVDKVDKNVEIPFLLRKKYHKQGKDIILIKSTEDFERESLKEDFVDTYFVPFIKADIELGVHLVNKKVVKVFKKVLNEENSTFIKNQKSCHFHIINDLDNNFKTAQSLCENLFEKLDLNFGRVDIAYNSDTKKYIIWEVNTAPGLNKVTAQLYAEKLREIINV